MEDENTPEVELPWFDFQDEELVDKNNPWDDIHRKTVRHYATQSGSHVVFLFSDDLILDDDSRCGPEDREYGALCLKLCYEWERRTVKKINTILGWGYHGQFLDFAVEPLFQPRKNPHAGDPLADRFWSFVVQPHVWKDFYHRALKIQHNYEGASLDFSEGEPDDVRAYNQLENELLMTEQRYVEYLRGWNNEHRLTAAQWCAQKKEGLTYKEILRARRKALLPKARKQGLKAPMWWCSCTDTTPCGLCMELLVR